MTHKKDCVWGNSDCEYKDAHDGCFHEEHNLKCNCQPAPKSEDVCICPFDDDTAAEIGHKKDCPLTKTDTRWKHEPKIINYVDSRTEKEKIADSKIISETATATPATTNYADRLYWEQNTPEEDLEKKIESVFLNRIEFIGEDEQFYTGTPAAVIKELCEVVRQNFISRSEHEAKLREAREEERKSKQATVKLEAELWQDKLVQAIKSERERIIGIVERIKADAEKYPLQKYPNIEAIKENEGYNQALKELLAKIKE